MDCREGSAGPGGRGTPRGQEAISLLTPLRMCAFIFVCVCVCRGENPWGVSHNIRREEGCMESAEAAVIGLTAVGAIDAGGRASVASQCHLAGWFGALLLSLL